MTETNKKYTLKDLKPQAQAIIGYIKEHGESSLEVLSDELGSTKKSISGSVLGLQKKNLAVRDRRDAEEGNGQTSYVSLTQEGESIK